MAPFQGSFPPRRPRRGTSAGTLAKSRRGDIGERWWSRRFVEALEWITDSNRLGRGRSYARSGQVIGLEAGPGIVTALVQGSRRDPYQVRIELDQFTDGEWERVEQAMAEQAVFLAALLAGEMPEEIEQAFEAAGVSLFPKRIFELRPSCSCPDAAVPCKHSAATLYILAERFDQDPFEILAWRGRSRSHLIRRLRKLRASALSLSEDPEIPGPGSMVPVQPISSDPAAFWRMGTDPGGAGFSPHAPNVPDAILRQFGPIDAFIDGQPASQALARLYEIATRNAELLAFQQDDPLVGEGSGED